MHRLLPASRRTPLRAIPVRRTVLVGDLHCVLRARSSPCLRPGLEIRREFCSDRAPSQDNRVAGRVLTHPPGRAAPKTEPSMPPDHRSFLRRRSDVLAGSLFIGAPKGAAMSTTDNDGETQSEREPEERPSQRLHDLYRADLRPFEPVSDAQLLGAIDRAEVHDKHDHASRSDIAAHLGFAHNSWTTRRLGPQLDALRTVGHIRDVHRYGLDLLALTAAGRRALGKARSAGQVILPESPQHRRWQHSRTIAHERIDGSVKRYEGRWPKPALCSTLSKSPRMRGSISPSAWGRRAGSSARPPTACTSGPSPTTHVPTPIRRRGSEDDATAWKGD